MDSESFAPSEKQVDEDSAVCFDASDQTVVCHKAVYVFAGGVPVELL